MPIINFDWKMKENEIFENIKRDLDTYIDGEEYFSLFSYTP